MYRYVIEGNESLTINTPDFKEVDSKHDIKADKIIKKITFSNGLALEMEQLPNRITIMSNKKLKKNEDGSFDVIFENEK